MRSKNTKIFADYYLLLEEVIKYFNDYQLELNKIYIIKLKSKITKKDNKISSLEEKMDIIIKNNEKLLKTNEETNLKLNETSNEVKLLLKINKRLDKRGRIVEDKLNDANYKLEDIQEDLNDMAKQKKLKFFLFCHIVEKKKAKAFLLFNDTNHKLDYTCKKLNIAVEKRVPDTNDRNKFEDLVLLKNRNKNSLYKYYAIRAQTKYVNKKVEKMITQKNYKQILRIDNVANSVNIWNRLKEKLKDQVDYCGNELNLISISETNFIDMLKEVYDKRKDIVIINDSNSEEYSDED
jgi:hypothetical protein